jgi:hypothetical protein
MFGIQQRRDLLTQRGRGEQRVTVRRERDARPIAADAIVVLPSIDRRVADRKRVQPDQLPGAQARRDFGVIIRV